MNISKKECRLIAVLSVLYVSILAIVWVLQSQAAKNLRDGLMASSAETAIAALDFTLEPEAIRTARLFVSKWGSVTNAMRADITSELKTYDFEEFNIVDTNGFIVASGDPGLIGFDMSLKPTTGEFLQLNTGRPFVIQRFRMGCPEGGINRWVKYVGLPFPGGGFIQVGQTYRHFDSRFRYALDRVMRNARAGETGFYLLVDRQRDTVVSGFDTAWCGTSVQNLGIQTDAAWNNDNILLMNIQGVDSYVRRIQVEFAQLDIYIIIPRDEINRVRARAVLTVALILALIFSIGGGLIAKVIRQHEHLEAFHRREAEHLEHDLQLARSIQMAALPSSSTNIPNIDLYAHMRTAREVGGDFYDYALLSLNRLYFICADVSDKGIPAALFMMKAKSTLRSALQSTDSLREAVKNGNTALALGNNDSNMFVTAWIGCLDLTTGQLEYVNAGHNPPYLRHADGSLSALRERHGLVLAASELCNYRSDTITLQPGDQIFLYTDGVTEAMNNAHELFGESRLEKVLAQTKESPHKLCHTVIHTIDTFAQGAPQSDDITVLALTYKG